jgi:conjugal transfer mating pair stabilization protein TraN
MFATMKLIEIKILFLCLFILAALKANADINFAADYPCKDSVKTCLASGPRNIDGFIVTKDCWEFLYEKTCAYPSKNDCGLFAHCYGVANGQCLLKDLQQNCVNLERIISCPAYFEASIIETEAAIEFKENEPLTEMICKNIPCLDGDCVDKSYVANDEMMDSVAKLHLAKSFGGSKGGKVSLFEGKALHCNDNMAGFSNCCAAGGWGQDFLGASCSDEEKLLASRQKKGLCIFVGKKVDKRHGIDINSQYYSCCFSNMLEKIVQEQGRKALNISFGSPVDMQCRGLSMEELQKIDFNNIDFSPFANELMMEFGQKYQTPKPADIEARIKNNLNIQKYDGNHLNPDNNLTGFDKKFQKSKEAK